MKTRPPCLFSYARWFLAYAVLGAFTVLTHSSASAQSASETSAPSSTTSSSPEFQRPAFQPLRHREDWSVLRGFDRNTTGGFLDAFKYIPLSNDEQVWVSFGGSARARLESWRDFNFGAPPQAKHDDTYLLTRLLFHADLHVGEHIRVFMEGKSALSTDRELVGGKRTLDVDTLDLQNGFLDLLIPIDDADSMLTLRAGRQELLFGRQRLVSPLDWANTRRTFDGVSGIFQTGDWTLTGFWTQAVPVRKYSFNEPDRQTQFFGLYAAGKLYDTSLALDLYYLGLLRDDDVNFNGTVGHERRHTLGSRIGGKLGTSGFDFDLEGAYQFGDVGPGDIDAFMVAAQLGYTFADIAGTPRVFVGFDYASGDHQPGGDVQTFNQLFPLGHAYFGYIDAIGRQNIIDLSTGLTFKPFERLTFDLHGHFFWRADSDDALYNAGGASVRPGSAGNARYIGAELDLLLRYQLNTYTEVQFGYSHFFTGRFIEQSGPAKDVDFLYASIQFTF